LRVADASAVTASTLDHVELQDFIDELDAAGVNPSTIEGAVLPLRQVFRCARARGMVGLDPTDGLELPEKSARQRVPPSPSEAAALLPRSRRPTARSGPWRCWPASAEASSSPSNGRTST
jgi:site-specific recombinase XerD